MTIDFNSQDFQNALKTRNVVLDYVQHNELQKAKEALSYISTNIALKDTPRWLQDINERLTTVEICAKQHILSHENFTYLIKIPMADGTPLLIYAIAQKAEALVLKILNSDVSVTTQDSKGKSAFSYMQEHFGLPWIEKILHHCSYKNSQKMLRGLIEAGNEALVLQALSNERTCLFLGKTECTLAAEHHMRTIVQVFIQRGLVLSCKLLATFRASFDTATVNELIALIPINDKIFYTIRNLLAPESKEVATAVALVQRIEALPAEQQPSQWNYDENSQKRNSIFAEIFCGAALHGHKMASLARGGSPIEMGATQKTALMWAADLEMLPTTIELLHASHASTPKHNGLSGIRYVVKNATDTFLTALVNQWPWEDKEITCNLLIEVLLKKNFTLASQLLEQLSLYDSTDCKWVTHPDYLPSYYNTRIISAAIQSDYPGLDSLLQKEFSIFDDDGRTPLECFAEKRLDHHITSFLSQDGTITVEQLERIEKLRGAQYVDNLLQELLKYPHHFSTVMILMLQSGRFSKAQEILSTEYKKKPSEDSLLTKGASTSIYEALLKLGTPEACSEARKLEALGTTIYNFNDLLKKLSPAQKEAFITQFWDIQKTETFRLFYSILENDTHQIAELLLKKVLLSDVKPNWWNNANARNALFCLACQKKYEAVCDYLCRAHDNEPYMTIPTSPPGDYQWRSCPLYNAILAGYKQCALLLIRNGASVYLRTSSCDDSDDGKTFIEHIEEKFGFDCVCEIAASYPLSKSTGEQLCSLNWRPKEWNFGHLLLERIQQLNPSWWNEHAKTKLFFSMLTHINRFRNNERYVSDLLLLASECDFEHPRYYIDYDLDPIHTAIENNFLDLVFVLMQRGAKLFRTSGNKNYSVLHALEKCIKPENPKSIQRKDILALIDELPFENHPEAIKLIAEHIKEKSYDIAEKIYTRIPSPQQKPTWWTLQTKMVALSILFQNRNDIRDIAGPLASLMCDLETTTTQNDITAFLRTICTINPKHLSSLETTIEIPTKNGAVDISTLHTLFQSHVTLTEEQLSSLITFETRVKNRTPYLGTPTATNQNQLNAFYKTIEDATCLVMETLQTRIQTVQQANQNKSLKILKEEGNRTATEFYDLFCNCARHYIQSASLCGPAIYMNAIDEYRTVVLKKSPKTFQEQLKSLLAESRSIIVSGLFNADEQSLHAYTLFVQRFGAQLGLPLTNAIGALHDIFTTQHSDQVTTAIKQFSTIYTPQVIFETISAELCERTLRDECLDYLKKNSSPFADEGAYEIIMHHLKTIFATGTSAQKAEKVAAFLQKKSLAIMDTSSLESISKELLAIMQSEPKALFLAQIQELDSNNKPRFTLPTLLSILLDANILQLN